MAGLGRKEWSPGDTLTAADVNGYLMDQSVMVFAGTAARASAIPSPSAGMVAYSTATNLEYYNGSSWESVGVTPGLVYITGAPFTAQGTISMPAGTFTTTYKTYKVILQITASSTDLNVLCRVNASGSPVTTSGQYAWAKTGTFTNGSENVQGGYVSETSARINQGRNSIYMAAPLNDITIYDPANASTYTQATGNWVGGIDNNGINAAGYHGFTIASTGAHDGLTFLTSTGTITGFYRVYGLSES